MAERFDVVVVGSGFGGSVSALRLAEKGYRVLVLEKGRRFGSDDFAKTTWDVRRWVWMPRLGLRGIFQVSSFEHMSVLHGVGVGGGSLGYAATLPIPRDDFFRAPSWAHLADWRRELEPHYTMARRMLGVAPNPRETAGDRTLRTIAREIGRPGHVQPTDVGVYFGEPTKTVKDPYFGGDGPARVGCTFCGACMTGCRVGAKNSLDRNYLFLAERRGARVVSETEVKAVRQGVHGYVVEARGSARRSKQVFEADRVVFAGGVVNANTG